MSNLEHLIENGLHTLKGVGSKEEWVGIMKKDRNWQGNEHIKISDLWEICQYVIYVHDEFK